MGSVNRVILLGNVGFGPEVKGGDKGSVTTFKVVTNEFWRDSSGNKQERAEWHRVVTFGKLAELCGEYLYKGRPVYIEGSIRSNLYKDKDGQEKRSYEVIASDVKFFGPSKQESEAKKAEEKAEDDNFDV